MATKKRVSTKKALDDYMKAAEKMKSDPKNSKAHNAEREKALKQIQKNEREALKKENKNLKNKRRVRPYDVSWNASMRIEQERERRAQAQNKGNTKKSKSKKK